MATRQIPARKPDPLALSTAFHSSPLGRILLACDNIGLTGVWFEGQKFFPGGLSCEPAEKASGILAEAARWLDIYFSGREPCFTPLLHMLGTPFQVDVWRLMLEIPYGQTATYGVIARRIALARHKPAMSAQAVGQAVGHNPISIIVPCHRVVGANGKLVGYGGGVDKKRWLLARETA